MYCCLIQKCCAIEESNVILCDGELRNNRGTVCEMHISLFAILKIGCVLLTNVVLLLCVCQKSNDSKMAVKNVVRYSILSWAKCVLFSGVDPGVKDS